MDCEQAEPWTVLGGLKSNDRDFYPPSPRVDTTTTNGHWGEVLAVRSGWLRYRTTDRIIACGYVRYFRDRGRGSSRHTTEE